MFFLEDKNKKPEQWDLDKGLVDPEWMWVWDGSFKLIVPFWRTHPSVVGEIAVRDYSGGRNNFLTELNGASWLGTQRGLGLDFDGITEAARVVGFSSIYQATDDDFSFYVEAKFTGDPDFMLGEYKGQKGAEGWGIKISADKMVFSGGGTGGFQNSNFSDTVVAPGDFVRIAGSWDQATTSLRHILSIAGAAEPITTMAHGKEIDPSSKDFRIGSVSNHLNQGTFPGGWTITTLYLRDRQMIDSQLRLLMNDPFGPFRMDDEAGVVFAVAVVFTSANLALHHSGASDIGGAIAAALIDDALNNLWDDVSSTDADAGDTEYRCAYVKNTHGSLSVANVKIEIDTDPTESNWEIALGAAGKNGSETEVANEDTAPSGPSFGTGPLSLGTLAAGDFYPIWLKRIVSAGAGAATPDSGVLRILGDDPN